MNINEIVADLTEDGDTVKLDDGRLIRLRIQPDQFANPFEEYDTYGRLAQPVRDRNTGREGRPDFFDGNAEKVGSRSDTWWWQPPSDVKRGTEAFTKLRRRIPDLIEYGLFSVTVELCQGKDAYGRDIVVNVSSVGACDLGWYDLDERRESEEHLANLVTDMLRELLEVDE